MNTEQERCVKCDYCDLEDFFWDGKRLCFIYRCRIFRDTIQKAAVKCPYHLKTNKPTGDMIRHPDHYTFRGREAIEAVRIMDGEAESKDGYLMRAIIKLLYRYPRKNGKQDLDLAIECIKMLREEYTDHPKKREGDMIKHPDHYTFRGVEAIEVVKIMTATATGVEAYLLGCAVKYLYRYPRKNGKQDLDKAIQCIKMLRDYLYGKEDKE